MAELDRAAGWPVAYVYTLDPATGDYSLIGTFRDRLKICVPFDIDIDFGTLDDYR